MYEVWPVPPSVAGSVEVKLAALPLMLPEMSDPGIVDEAVIADVPLPFT